jgi:hypothetical protein
LRRGRFCRAGERSARRRTQERSSMKFPHACQL